MALGRALGYKGIDAISGIRPSRFKLRIASPRPPIYLSGMTYFRALALLGLLLAAFFAAPIRDPIFAQGGGCTLVNYTCQCSGPGFLDRSAIVNQAAAAAA
jgi:hypothetical protein